LYIYSEKHVNLIPITKGTNGPLDYAFDLGNSSSLAGAHGEEIVRDLFTDVHVSSHGQRTLFFSAFPNNCVPTQTHTTYTCGEDGQVRAWKGPDGADMDVDEGATSSKKRRKDKKEKDKARFKPY
jgi:hypothetical protein